MNEPFRVSMESPQSGWMSLRLRAGEQSFVAVVSYAPYDSLRDLIKGLTTLLSGYSGLSVRWNAEPEEYDFAFERRGHEIELKVIRYRDHRRIKDTRQTVFSFRRTDLEICLPFWHELRQLHARSETDVFEQNWRQAFPQQEMQELTKAVEIRRRATQTHLT